MLYERPLTGNSTFILGILFCGAKPFKGPLRSSKSSIDAFTRHPQTPFHSFVRTFRSLSGRKRAVQHVRTTRHRKSEKGSTKSGRHFIESENHQSQSGNDQKESVRNPEESSHSQHNRCKSKENSCEAEVTSVLFAKYKHFIRVATVVLF